MNNFRPRVKCADGVSLSVQSHSGAYCDPRNEEFPSWKDYILVEVGFIMDAEDKPFTPPEEWRKYADGDFPNNVYAYVPTEIVEAFIESHGGEILETISDLEVIKAMRKYGGSFCAALAEAAFHADDINLRKIKEAWPEYWQEYTMFAIAHERRKEEESLV